ncbi:MAG: hypothetical protein JNM56_31250 [Planctomycetia bacterium]|nr:hypothetical protein [Planctomycetia bacterium]
MPYRINHRLPAALLGLLLAVTTSSADEKPPAVKTAKHQVTGLFMKEREQDLREIIEQLPQIKLGSIDYAHAEAVFEYEPAKAFPGAKPEQIVERFDNLLRGASKSTFGIKPLRTMPLDKLQRVEIPIAGLDCKACCLAAYESVYKLPGVESATASFRDGLLTALIDPEKTDRAKLEEALKKRGISLK